MVDEDEAGTIFQAGFRSEVLIIDFSDDVLTHLREYDPVTDSLEEIYSFSEASPTALPALPDLVAAAHAWAEEEGAARLHFDCARDEPVPKTSGAKKAPAKRITNASLAEQVQALAAQVGSAKAVQHGVCTVVPGSRGRLGLVNSSWSHGQFHMWCDWDCVQSVSDHGGRPCEGPQDYPRRDPTLQGDGVTPMEN